MRKVTVSASTVEEALEIAKKQHNLLDGEFEYKIVDKGFKGFFGLFARNAVVEITFKSNYYERKLREFFQTIFAKFGQVEINISSSGKKFTVKLNGENLKEWAVKNKEVVPAIQHLATILINRVSDTKLCVEVDVGDLKEKRQKNLHEIVEQAISKVKNGAKKIVLEPMSAKERRMVHELVKRYKHLKSYSIGVEPYRRVVIEYYQEEKN
ncbi:R3H domain-containing nucleic acid-binding protein [Pseudothermotoga thermarum]|uniref:Single-stranded nucleic acid binding R3H domain-containing protein n=1 Tax=Pseudothermotoga thermarum DSM 5069 TaxID=688269 RepID=F7YXS9_9THEM|nr:R3H domain-containing nucleic acid-binding protein [Pseudothermotoga thermarum]AEH50723.1 single-stranded nucleic acid binding R3H domain-containing protein [Pseudothermotoga thermarum DSM 5069]